MSRNQRRDDEKRPGDAAMQAIVGHYDRGRQAQDAGDLSAAAQAYKKVLALWPTHAAARDRLGTARIRRRFHPRRAAFEAMLRQRDFSTDWFTSRLCEWLAVFERHPLPADADILEIGSWEGMSALFVLSTWPGIRITCVDTWAGGRVFEGTRQAAECERRFDANLREGTAAGRVALSASK